MSEVPEQTDYATVHADIVALLEVARRAVARSVNGLITASSCCNVCLRISAAALAGASAWTTWNKCGCSTWPIHREGFPRRCLGKPLNPACQ